MKDDWGQLSCSVLPLHTMPLKLSRQAKKLECAQMHCSLSRCLTRLFQLIDSAYEALYAFGWHISSIIS